MKAATRHTLIPFLVALTFALGLSCAPRSLAGNGAGLYAALMVDR